MAEELEDAAYTLPRTMMYSTLANGAMGLIMIVSYCYCIGDFLKGSIPTVPIADKHDAKDRGSILNSNKVRIHPSFLQLNWLVRGRQRYGLCRHHRHHLLLDDDDGNDFTSTVRVCT